MSIDNNFLNRLNKEFLSESDRGCAILTVCLLEETLLSVFTKILPTGKESARNFMPRGRISLGISNAEALGLIAEPEVTNLKLILKIRNAFAHKLLDGLNFDSTEIKEHVLKLKMPNLDGISETTRIKIESIPRERYMEVFGHAVAALERVAHIAKPLPIYKSLPSFSIEI